jgi:hypothetical protein
MTSSFLRLLDHTQWRITVGRTLLDEWLTRRRDLYLTTTFATNIHASGGIPPHNLSRRAAPDPQLRPCGHWDGLISNLPDQIIYILIFVLRHRVGFETSIYVSTKYRYSYQGLQGVTTYGTITWTHVVNIWKFTHDISLITFDFEEVKITLFVFVVYMRGYI